MGTGEPGEFGRRLRQLREAAALSQEELAERAAMSAKAVGALERGERRRPYPNTVRALAQALDLDEEGTRSLAGSLVADPVRAAGPDPATTIPLPPAPMLGRTAEVAQVVELLATASNRVVTLTGPGGVGKTRLALEVAHALQRQGREVVVVELAAVRREDLVLPTVARSLGLQVGSEDLIGALVGVLAGRAPVLVLDNLEHLVHAAADVAELVRRCAGVAVLATSRAPLRIRAEHEVPVGPLPVPGADVEVAAVASSDAVQMFADRARTVVPGFEVTPANAVAVGEICRRLDGLPLALELAAAHVQYLAPAQLLDRLGHAVGSARLRDLPERQQTMRATLEWSHALLTGDEQEVLGSLTVFAGGFDLEAAEVVAGEAGRDVLSAVEGLVEQSLVAGPGLGGGSRLRMLEPVRDHAASLLEPADLARLADRHAAHFVELGGRAGEGLRTADLPTWLDRLGGDHANLRAALTTLVDRGDLEAAARLGGDTWLYWALRGHAGEGLTWWQGVLDADPGTALGDRAAATSHLALAGLHLATGDPARARSHAESASVGARAAADPALLAEVLVLACMGATFTGELPAAAAHLEELSVVGSGLDDAWTRAHTAIARAQVALVQGDLAGGAEALDVAEELARGGAGQFTLATLLNMRTTVGLLVGDDEVALRCAREATEVASEVGTTWTLVYTLSALGTLAARRDRPDLAATLFAAGEATAETSLLAVSFRPDVEVADLQLAEVRRQLTTDQLHRAWERGRALCVEEVLELIPEISAAPAPR